jgi:L-threonylcarbamoyladenylate synthase
LSHWHLKQAAHYIHQGGIVAYPTEAVYGLGCDPCNQEAVYRLLNIKQRKPDKGLILIASDFNQLRPYLDLEKVTDTIMEKVMKSWPGPTTWLLPAKEQVPHHLRGRHATIAVRITAHPIASALCQAAACALVSTSANRTGHPAACTPLKTRAIFRDEVDYILTGTSGPLNLPTEIKDAITDRVIRPA